MKIPVYNQQVIPKGQNEEVFSLPGEKETVRKIPAKGLEEAKAKSRYYDVMFDIGSKIEAARDADATADAQVSAFEEYQRIQQTLKDPMRTSPKIMDKSGELIDNPNYIAPENYKQWYEGKSKKARDTILNSFGGRPRAKEKVGRYLTDLHNREGVKVNTLARGKQVEDMTAKFYKRMDNNLERFSVMYNNGDTGAIAELLALTKADTANAVSSGLISPAQAAATVRNMQIKSNDAAQMSDINREYNASLESKSTKPLEDLLERYKTPDKDDIMTENMRIQYKIMVENMIRKVDNQITTKNYLEQAQLEDAIDDAVASVEMTGKTDMNKVNDMIFKAYPGEENKERRDAIWYKFGQETMKAGATYVGVDTVKNTSLNDMGDDGWFDSQVSNMRPEIQQHAKKAMALEAVRKSKALNTDPMSYLKDLETYKKMTTDHNSIMKNENIPEEERARVHNEYLDNVVNYQKNQGVAEENIRMLTNGEAKLMVGKLLNANADQIDQSLKSLEANYGKHYDVIFNDLARQKLPEGLKMAGAMNLESQSQVRRDLIESYLLTDKQFSGALGIEKADIRKEVNEEINKSDMMEDFTASLMRQGTTAENIETLANTKEAVRLLAYQYVFKSGKTNRAGDATEQAIEDTIGALYEYNGNGYRIPAGYDREQIERTTRFAVRNMTVDNLSDDRYENKESLLREIKNSGYWVNNKDGNGLELRLQVGPNVVVLYNKDNEIIQNTFDNFNKPDAVETEKEKTMIDEIIENPGDFD